MSNEQLLVLCHLYAYLIAATSFVLFIIYRGYKMIRWRFRSRQMDVDELQRQIDDLHLRMIEAERVVFTKNKKRKHEKAK